MDAGLQILNDTLNFQIDSTFKNVCYEYTLNGIGADTIWEIAVDQNKIYILEPPQGIFVGVAPFAKSDTEPYYRIFGGAKVHVYGDNQTTRNTGAGLQVFNGLGEKVFDSDNIQLKILDYVYGYLGPVSQDIRDNYDYLLQSKNYDTARLGILLGQTPVGLNWYRQTQKFSGCYFKTEGQNVELRFRQMYIKSGYPITMNSFNSYWVSDMYSYTVADITGIPQ
ncbi:hypothetical protein [Acinetobacter baumannii]|uniref:hypothetical protein n=1 Tax=Acinetobacter baumannii TaxID=470 RepID=UPI003AF55FF1